MSVQSKKQYNLRSHKGTSTQVPVEFQVSDDQQFLNSILQNSTLSQQTNEDSTDSEHSLSLNLSDSSHDSDDDHDLHNCDKSARSFHKFDQENIPSTSAGASAQKVSTLDVQGAINAQILSQLEKLGKRLEKIEQNNCRKTSDKTKIKSMKRKAEVVQKTKKSKSNPVQQPLPSTTLESMKQDVILQAKVEERLQELTELAKTGTASKLKSQRGGKVEVLVKNRVKWPHEFVLSGTTRERVTYDQLNVTQWVAGFGRTIREESDPKMKAHMLEYMIALMDDANDFSCTSAKASHAVLLCRMEQGEVTSYADTMAIERIRRANAQKISTGSQYFTNGTQNFTKKFSKTTRTMPCTYYNQGVCSQTKSHETRGVLYKHICSSCFANNGKTFPHSEVECKNKSRGSKNE